ncbi:hypothetical protein [Streptomyces platensis]|uniref:hypothetical protein n=1 Tax=Streptomyces platensis TaxID=58346 RepID=UPI003870D6DD|nr:hypothetical protein OG962_04820 [Streptomyces platensis]
MYGLFSTLPEPTMVEMIGCAGYDFVIPKAVRTLRAACARHAVPFCAMSTTPERRAEWRADGVTAFVVGEDRDLAARALRGHLAHAAGRE